MTVVRTTLSLLAALSMLVLSACAPKCDASTCKGCCDAKGVCQSLSATTCGIDGAACNVCIGAQSCQAGVCAAGGGTGGGSAGGGTGGGAAGGSGGGAAGGTGGGAAGGTGGGTGGGAAGGGTGGAGILVTGIAPTHFIQGATETVVPWNPAALPIAAYTLSGGTFTQAPVTPSGDGGFSFSVPSVPYFVGIGKGWLVTDATTLDLGTNHQGHPGQGPAPDAGASVDVTATGLAPWDDVNDLLQVASEAVFEQGSLSGTLAAGVTSCTNSSFTYSSLTSVTALDAAHGDTAVVSQVRTSPLPTDAGTFAACSGIIASGETGPVSLPAPNAQLTVSLAPVTQQSVSLDWRGSAWLALASQVHPAASASYPYATIVGIPGGLGRGYVGYLSELLSCDLTDQPDGVVQVRYGNPRAAWGEQSSAGMTYFVPVQLPAPATRGDAYGFASSTGPSILSAPLVPVMGTPRSLAVDSRPAQGAPLTLGSATPLVSWLAPTSGTPTFYRVTVEELYLLPASNRTRTRLAGDVVVPAAQTQVRLPPGLLTAGKSYVLRVDASDAAGGAFSPASSPWYDALTDHQADALSSQLNLP